MTCNPTNFRNGLKKGAMRTQLISTPSSTLGLPVILVDRAKTRVPGLKLGFQETVPDFPHPAQQRAPATAGKLGAPALAGRWPGIGGVPDLSRSPQFSGPLSLNLSTAAKYAAPRWLGGPSPVRRPSNTTILLFSRGPVRTVRVGQSNSSLCARQ